MKNHLLSVFAIVIMAALAAGSVDSNAVNSSGAGNPPVPKTPEEIKKERIEKQFSLWNGAHNNLTEAIKESMNDPKSYEHVETRYIEFTDYLTVTTTFRGKNAFGGVVKQTVVAKVDLDGNILEILSTE